MAVNCSLKEKQEAGQTPAESAKPNRLLQHIGYKSDSVGKGRSDAKKEATHAGVHVLKESARVIRSRAYSTAHPHRSGDGLLECRQNKLSSCPFSGSQVCLLSRAHVPCPRHESGLKSIFGAACSWLC